MGLRANGEGWEGDGAGLAKPSMQQAGPGGLLYLVPGREAAAVPVPRDLGVSLPRHHAVQVQCLPFSHMGGGGLDVDGLGTAPSWGSTRSWGTARSWGSARSWGTEGLVRWGALLGLGPCSSASAWPARPHFPFAHTLICDELL